MEADFRIQNYGSIFLFDPQNATAEEHLRENVEEEALWFCGALVVEPRYASALAAALLTNGFKIS